MENDKAFDFITEQKFPEFGLCFGLILEEDGKVNFEEGSASIRKNDSVMLLLQTGLLLGDMMS